MWQADEVKLNISNAEMRPRILPNQDIKGKSWPNGQLMRQEWVNRLWWQLNACVEICSVALAPHYLLAISHHLIPLVLELNRETITLGVDIELPMPSFKTHGQSDSDELSTYSEHGLSTLCTNPHRRNSNQ